MSLSFAWLRPAAVVARAAAVFGIFVIACAAPTPPQQAAGARVPPAGLEYAPPPPGSYELPPIEPAVDGAIIDADGTRRHLFDYLGDRYVLLSFIYTHCTDSEGCPLATGVLDMVRESLGSEPDLAAHVRLITLSFDPERDSPEVMHRYAALAGRDYAATRWDARPWAFLTTASRADLQPILDGYGQSLVREIDAAGKPTGDFSHVLKVFLVDTQRRVRNIYSTSFLHPAIAINDLKTLWMEDGGRG